MATPFKEIWVGLDPDQKKALAADAGTSVSYLSMLAHGVKTASLETIARLVKVRSEITFDSLRPDMAWLKDYFA